MSAKTLMDFFFHLGEGGGRGGLADDDCRWVRRGGAPTPDKFTIILVMI